MAADPAPSVLLLGEAWPTDSPGGLNRYLADLLAALERVAVDDGGVAPHAIVLGPATDAPSSVVRASSVHAGLAARMVAFRRAARAAAGSTTVVDAHFALYASVAVLGTRLRSVPLVVHFQGPWADESALAGASRVAVVAKRAVERAVYRRARRVVVLSEAFARIAIERYGVDPARVVVLPPAVDLERFTPGDRGPARARLGVPDGAFLVVAARRLDPRMGLDTLLTAWADVQAAVPDAVLLVAGDGSARSVLEHLRDALPRPEAVRFLGRVDDATLLDLYRAADCSVVPTRALEGFGLVVLESLACGTPAIVTDAGGLPDGVVGLDSTLVVPSEDPERLTTRLVEAARGALPPSDACRRHAERFEWGAVARAHCALYAEVTAPAAPASPQLRVAFLDHCAQPSGGELALARLLPALPVHAEVVLAEDGPLVERLRADGASVRVLPMADAGRSLARSQVKLGRAQVGAAVAALRYTLRLARVLRRLDVDVVHTNSLKAALYGGVAGRLARTPVVWHVRDRIADDYLSRAGTRVVRAAARVLPSAVLANSAATLATIEPSLRSGVPRAVVPDSATVDVHPRVGGDRMTTIGIVGRLAPWKGQILFLEAFATAFPDDAELRAIVVGGALFEEDRAYAALVRARSYELGLGSRVELLGHVDDMTDVYARLDVLVHASTVPEPFGQVVVEAMAAGVPVVAADAGGPREIVTHEVDALLYPPGDVAALVACLRRLRDDAGLRARLADAGRHRAAEYTPARTAAAVMDAYRQLRGVDAP